MKIDCFLDIWYSRRHIKTDPTTQMNLEFSMSDDRNTEEKLELELEY